MDSTLRKYQISQTKERLKKKFPVILKEIENYEKALKANTLIKNPKQAPQFSLE